MTNSQRRSPFRRLPINSIARSSSLGFALGLLLAASWACTTETTASQRPRRDRRAQEGEPAPADPRPLVRPGEEARCQSGPIRPEGSAPHAEIGGLISIPGNPLPPVSPESIKAAIPAYEAILSVSDHFLDVPSRARGIGYLATLYAASGKADRAEQLFGEALALAEKGAATGGDLGWIHNNRGLVRLSQRRYAEAARSFRAAVDALTPESAELREPRAIACQNLASAYHILGDLEPAESAYLEALATLRRLGRGHDRTYQTTSQNLAALYGSIGDVAEARTILEELRAQGVIGDRSLRFAILNDLGLALRRMKEFPAAEARLREALTLTAEGDSNQALALMNLAATHGDAGDLALAQEEGERALHIVETLADPGAPSAAAIEATLGTLAFHRGDLAAAEQLLGRAKATLARATEGQQRALAEIDEVLALIAQRQGQGEAARALAREALGLEILHLDQILAVGSEAQRLAYQRDAYPYL